MKKSLYISKRKTFTFKDTPSTRSLVVIKGSKAGTTPLNKVIKKLKLKGNWKYADYYKDDNTLLLSRWNIKKRK